jgi:hypothetical protein
MKSRLIYFAILCLMFFFSPAPASLLYVNLNSANPASPYGNWAAAATNIQDAIDASNDGDQIWVTKGIRQCMLRNTNRLKCELHLSEGRLLQ